MRLISWAQRNERHLGAVLFVFGFVTDLFTFVFLPVSFVNLAFLGYLGLAAVCTLGSHVFSNDRQHSAVWRRTLSVIFPLGAQYAIGSLLSGCLIFYTKSSTLIVSWPFLVLLALVFIGNEYFRTYYKFLAFQLVLFFFAIYAYAIFSLPLFLHRLGIWIFVGSTAVSIVAFIMFMMLLRRLNGAAVHRSLRYVVPSTTLIVLIVSISYVSGLIPPIPLTMPHAGIYQDLRRENGDYILASQGTREWWDLRPQKVRHLPGTPLYAFTSISAPIQFGTSVVHVWEWYDESTGKWSVQNRISFPISGGRDGGYRGYSVMDDPQAGRWRLTIETGSRQVIGRLYFMVETVDEMPPLLKEIQ
jgi:hypothetical protein